MIGLEPQAHSSVCTRHLTGAKAALLRLIIAVSLRFKPFELIILQKKATSREVSDINKELGGFTQKCL
ncbi:MAG: uncharacterized protein KVP18_004024 [Porospora cf. gigantea A]|uniref:uncharacterized protein n=1 Tax=Porospora cf. gigantea A TaxID=2853593 RepID=UPI00355A3350|nr:MAG: hypothetical protein KVP18_004024 [Porospora cf. gigantea A]